MLVIVNVDVWGAARPMTPAGLSAVRTMPGRMPLRYSAIASTRSGRPCSTKPNTTNASARAGKTEKKA
jgi:hypothetical protein